MNLPQAQVIEHDIFFTVTIEREEGKSVVFRAVERGKGVDFVRRQAKRLCKP